MLAFTHKLRVTVQNYTNTFCIWILANYLGLMRAVYCDCFETAVGFVTRSFLSYDTIYDYQLPGVWPEE